jgi:hypothetical protein
MDNETEAVLMEVMGLLELLAGSTSDLLERSIGGLGSAEAVRETRANSRAIREKLEKVREALNKVQ